MKLEHPSGIWTNLQFPKRKRCKEIPQDSKRTGAAQARSGTICRGRGRRQRQHRGRYARYPDDHVWRQNIGTAKRQSASSPKIQVNSDSDTQSKSFSNPYTKQMNCDPLNEIKVRTIPHIWIKSISTTQTKKQVLTLNPSQSRPVCKKRVNVDHDHQHKNKVDRTLHWKQDHFCLHTVNFDPPHKNKPLSFQTLKPSQIRSLTQKSTLFRRHYWNQANSISTLVSGQFRCLHTKTKFVSRHTVTSSSYRPPRKDKVDADPCTEIKSISTHILKPS